MHSITRSCTDSKRGGIFPFIPSPRRLTLEQVGDSRAAAEAVDDQSFYGAAASEHDAQPVGIDGVRTVDFNDRRTGISRLSGAVDDRLLIDIRQRTQRRDRPDTGRIRWHDHQGNAVQQGQHGLYDRCVQRQ